MNVDPRRFRHTLFVVATEVRNLLDRDRTVGNVDITSVDVDVIKKVFIHETYVALQFVPLHVICLYVACSLEVRTVALNDYVPVTSPRRHADTESIRKPTVESGPGSRLNLQNWVIDGLPLPNRHKQTAEKPQLDSHVWAPWNTLK